MIALGLWAGSLAMTGAAAGLIFRAAREARPTLPDFAAYSGDHALVTGGIIANRLFWAADVAQFACAAMAILTLGVLAIFGRAWMGRIHAGMRILSLSLPLCALMYHLFVLSPRMAQNLNDYWTSAKQGDTAKASAAKAAFDADHPTASTTMGLTVVLILGAMCTAAWPARRDEDASA